MAKAVLGEFFATLIFLFVVEATATNLNITQDKNASIIGGVSTAFTAIAVIYSFADVSGAHFNPAVTFGTCVMGKTSWRKGACYMVAQLIGSVFSTLFVKAIFPRASQDNKPYNVVDNLKVDFSRNADKNINWQEAFGTEFILTFMLVYVIFAVAFDTVDTSNAVRVTTGANDAGAGDTEAIMMEEANAGASNNAGAGTSEIDRRVGRNLTIYTTSGSTKASFSTRLLSLLTFC